MDIFSIIGAGRFVYGQIKKHKEKERRRRRNAMLLRMSIYSVIIGVLYYFDLLIPAFAWIADVCGSIYEWTASFVGSIWSWITDLF